MSGETGLRVWLDDVRRPPADDWHWVRSVMDAIQQLESGEVIEMSLDFDLDPFERDGFEVCEWMRDHVVWPDLLHVHSANRLGSGKMCSFIQRSGYTRLPGRPRSFRRQAATSSHCSMNRNFQQAINSGDPLKVWLDDDLVDRKAPDGWIHITTAWEAITLLDSGNVVALSLDHDLGDDERFGRGIDVVNWLGEQQEVHDRPLWPEEGITLHTANPYGRDAMARAIKADAGRRFRVAEYRTAGNQPVFRMIPR